MKCLAVDTSGVHLTVALIDENAVISEFTEDTGLRHSISLMPTIERVLEKGKTQLNEIDVFACVVGPGSFTGIRIGVSTIKALSYANDKSVLPITSFEVLEYNKQKGKNLSIIDARHDNYYAMGYTDRIESYPACFLNKEQILKLSEEYTILSATDCDITNANCNLLDGLVNAVREKINNKVTDKEALIPLYVKKSQAEEG